MAYKLKNQILFWPTLLLGFCFSSVLAQNFGNKRITKIELTGGRTRSEGNVMVSTHVDVGGGRPLCDDSFGMAEANAICVELGFPRALRFTRRHYFGTDSSRWTPDGWKSMYVLSCPEASSSSSSGGVRSCTLEDNREDLCTLSEAAGVVCQPKEESSFRGCPNPNDFVCGDDALAVSSSSSPSSTSSCIEESLVCDGVRHCSDGSDETPALCQTEGMCRLESNLLTSLPDNSVAGTVFLKYNNTWSTVCHNDFDRLDAQVVCRNLGYGDGISHVLYKSYFGQDVRPIYSNKSSCRGDEESLTQCPDFSWNLSSCFTFQASGVFCHAGILGVQLVGGRRPGSGRVEIRSSSVSLPMAICDTGFDDSDAQVVCRMLGYESTEAVALKGSPFGMGSGPIWNVALDCLGDESSIQDCRVRFRNATCNHRSTAAVMCLRETSVDALLSRVLPSDCGQSVDASDRFITSLGLVRNGRIPSMFDVPWLAGLRNRVNGVYRHNCGAVVISEYYLLSAAHCFRDKGKLHYIVTVGEFNNKRNESFQQTFYIDELWVHEDFDSLSEFDKDIALIKIRGINGHGMRLGDRIKAVCLPSSGDLSKPNSCVVAGWGRFHHNFHATTEPRVGETLHRPDIFCERLYGSDAITSSLHCFGGNTLTNPCAGDSGGPVTCVGPSGQQTLYGIVSNGALCRFLNQITDVNVRVTHLLRWIQEKIYQDLQLG